MIRGLASLARQGNALRTSPGIFLSQGGGCQTTASSVLPRISTEVFSTSLVRFPAGKILGCQTTDPILAFCIFDSVYSSLDPRAVAFCSKKNSTRCHSHRAKRRRLKTRQRERTVPMTFFVLKTALRWETGRSCQVCQNNNEKNPT